MCFVPLAQKMTQSPRANPRWDQSFLAQSLSSSHTCSAPLSSAPESCHDWFCCGLTTILIHWFVLKYDCAWISHWLPGCVTYISSLSSPRFSLFWTNCDFFYPYFHFGQIIGVSSSLEQAHNEVSIINACENILMNFLLWLIAFSPQLVLLLPVIPYS